MWIVIVTCGNMIQVGELAGIAVGATVMLNILIAGYVPTLRNSKSEKDTYFI